MASCMRRLFKLFPWAPWWVPSALGAHHGHSSVPGCPLVTALAAGIIASAIDHNLPTERTQNTRQEAPPSNRRAPS
eukprot:12939006-Prorocentrum_lima.AAC.1